MVLVENTSAPIKIVILNNKKSQVEVSDPTIISFLKKGLSYKQPGVEFTPAFQRGWSGVTCLLGKNNTFDTALLFKVKKILSKNWIPFEVEDRRPAKVMSQPLDITDKLKAMNMVPRDHQVRIANMIHASDKGICRAVTSSGKTLSMGMIVAELNKPTIVFVIGLDSLEQFHNLFTEIFDEPIGWVGDGRCDIQRITIMSIWSAGKALGIKKITEEDEDIKEKDVTAQNKQKIVKALKEVKVALFDECHIVKCSTITDINKTIDPEYMYGFSGTPFPSNKEEDTLPIQAILGEQLVDVSATELIEKGIIAKPIIKFVSVPKRHGMPEQYQTVYKEYIVDNEERNNLIIENAKMLMEKKYTPLILFKQINHGKIIAEKLKAEGIDFEMLYGNDSLDKRREIKKRIGDGSLKLLLASTIFDMSVDIPQLNALVLAGSGKSSIRALQRIGRVIRISNSLNYVKKFAAVIDFFDQCKFLRQHSNARLQVYNLEKGFQVIKSKEMK